MRILIGMLALGLLVAPASANLLQDGGFEDGKPFTDPWSGNMDLNRPEAGPGGPAEGANYAGIQSGGGTSAVYSATLVIPSVAVSTLVTLTGMVHASPGAPSVDFFIELIDGSSTNDTVEASLHAPGVSPWAPFTLGPIHIDTGSVKIRIGFHPSGGWNGGTQLAVDALDLTPEPASLTLLGLGVLPLLRRRRR